MTKATNNKTTKTTTDKPKAQPVMVSKEIWAEAQAIHRELVESGSPEGVMFKGATGVIKYACMLGMHKVRERLMLLIRGPPHWAVERAK